MYIGAYFYGHFLYNTTHHWLHNPCIYFVPVIYRAEHWLFIPTCMGDINTVDLKPPSPPLHLLTLLIICSDWNTIPQGWTTLSITVIRIVIKPLWYSKCTTVSIMSSRSSWVNQSHWHLKFTLLSACFWLYSLYLRSLQSYLRSSLHNLNNCCLLLVALWYWRLVNVTLRAL